MGIERGLHKSGSAIAKSNELQIKRTVGFVIRVLGIYSVAARRSEAT